MFKKKVIEVVAYIEELDNIIKEPESQPEPEEEWVWVEGYKGTDENMQCYGNFQYELGRTYATDDVQMCEKGYHFCLNLKDVLAYYPWKENQKHRYFKVKGLVRKEAIDSYGTKVDSGIYALFSVNTTNRLVAKQIVLTEEITETKEVMEALQKTGLDIPNFEVYLEMRSIGYEAYHKIQCMSMLNGKYSDTFIKLLFADKSLDYCQAKCAEALAYAEEGISKDLAVYLLIAHNTK